MKRWDICEPRTGGALLHIGALQTGSDEDGTNNNMVVGRQQEVRWREVGME
jgi:hypothetical protein